MQYAKEKKLNKRNDSRQINSNSLEQRFLTILIRKGNEKWIICPLIQSRLFMAIWIAALESCHLNVKKVFKNLQEIQDFDIIKPI